MYDVEVRTIIIIEKYFPKNDDTIFVRIFDCVADVVLSKKILNVTGKAKLIISSLLKEMYEFDSKFFEDYSDEEAEK